MPRTLTALPLSLLLAVAGCYCSGWKPLRETFLVV